MWTVLSIKYVKDDCIILRFTYEDYYTHCIFNICVNFTSSTKYYKVLNFRNYFKNILVKQNIKWKNHFLNAILLYSH